MFTNFALIHVQVLLGGLIWTVVLSLISFVFGGLIGFALALAGVSKVRWVSRTIATYVALIQGSPVLIIMFVIYFGLPILGVEVGSLTAAGIALVLFSSAYLGTIWRASLQSVPKTQWEGADCLALTYAQRMGLVILPQAIRIATPPTVGFMVQIVKNTSLASVIGVVDVTYVGKQVNAATFQPFTTYLVIAVLYFCLCYPLSVLSRRFERAYSVSHR
ncbi:amino acid ABC transporter permease [Siculibacillus lacustris]|uniref:Amino acid ABC transporter permease n=1 Tax=Siculibacillus lacustris TaxID=1549641 RepID=A0A4Q9VXY8_9HYPH|nr:amino acid ABC transporter permease [Siculibacillus lacustris]TBW41362.1 amino acid ABC transporter permease [Siculibacillus lacustris]